MPISMRHHDILDVARQEGRVSVDSLAERFDVTPQTIRRDLADLAEEGLLRRVHGGAIFEAGTANLAYDARRGMAAEQKEAIGRLCAAAIPNGCSLFINIGTTTEAVARALLSHHGLMAVTNNLNVANILAQNQDCEVILSGGMLRRSDGGLVGEATVDLIRQFKVDYAIIGASAIDVDGTLLDYDFREVRAAQAIIENARQTFLVADSSKFSRVAPVRIAGIGAVSQFFTDLPPPEEMRQVCAASGVEIVSVDPSELPEAAEPVSAQRSSSPG